MYFKSPGPIDENYAGLWDFSINNQLANTIGLPTDDAQPIFGFFNSVRGNIYDDKRKALYTLSKQHTPDFSQNMRIVFAISRDNGQTWSQPVDISTTNFANRGFTSMALDTTSGDLYFGWYDGRNDPTYQRIEYFGAVIKAHQLDCLVEQIPLSDPLYAIPAPPTLPSISTPNESSTISAEDKKNTLLKRFNRV
jgi:hypothetical protein